MILCDLLRNKVLGDGYTNKYHRDETRQEVLKKHALNISSTLAFIWR